MSPKQCRVIVGVNDHWLLGSLTIGNGRIQDRLNDVQADYLTLSEVEVHSNKNCECLARMPQSVVPRAKIQFTGVPSEAHEAPQKRLLQYAKKDAYGATVVIAHYVIAGQLHLPQTAGDSALHTLTSQLSGFFPVTGADLVCSATGERVSFPVVFVNKEYVSGFHVDGEFTASGEADVFDRISKLLAESSAE